MLQAKFVSSQTYTQSETRHHTIDHWGNDWCHSLLCFLCVHCKGVMQVKRLMQIYEEHLKSSAGNTLNVNLLFANFANTRLLNVIIDLSVSECVSLAASSLSCCLVPLQFARPAPSAAGDGAWWISTRRLIINSTRELDNLKKKGK